MNDADAALLGERDGEVGFRNGIHGGGNDRNIQTDAPRQAGLGIDFGWEYFATGRFEQYIVEGKALGEYVLNHGDSLHDNVRALGLSKQIREVRDLLRLQGRALALDGLRSLARHEEILPDELAVLDHL